jgi:hypothetical protein
VGSTDEESVVSGSVDVSCEEVNKLRVNAALKYSKIKTFTL